MKGSGTDLKCGQVHCIIIRDLSKGAPRVDVQWIAGERSDRFQKELHFLNFKTK